MQLEAVLQLRILHPLLVLLLLEQPHLELLPLVLQTLVQGVSLILPVAVLLPFAGVSGHLNVERALGASSLDHGCRTIEGLLVLRVSLPLEVLGELRLGAAAEELLPEVFPHLQIISVDSLGHFRGRKIEPISRVDCKIDFRLGLIKLDQ